MEWPNEAYATTLFPSLETTTEGQIPAFPTEEPVWQIFAEGKERNLKHQISILDSTRIELIDRKTLSETITFDESKGLVMIE